MHGRPPTQDPAANGRAGRLGGLIGERASACGIIDPIVDHVEIAIPAAAVPWHRLGAAKAGRDGDSKSRGRIQ